MFLASHDIGVCWYALAKAKGIHVNGLNYVIMLAFGKRRQQDFRKDLSEFKRKNREEIWKGSFDSDVIEAVRLLEIATYNIK